MKKKFNLKFQGRIRQFKNFTAQGLKFTEIFKATGHKLSQNVCSRPKQHCV